MSMGPGQTLAAAVRSLRRSPGFALTAALTLGLGIGATTACFSVVHGVLFRSLPYPDADRLMVLNSNASWLDLQDLTRWARSYRAAGGSMLQYYDVVGGGEPVQIEAALVSGGLFRTLGVSPALGRVVDETDDRAGGAPVVVLSHGFWTRRLGADPSVLGKPVSLSGRTYTVVGVMPASFRIPGRESEAFVPAAVGLPPVTLYRGIHAFRTVWRRAPGVTEAQAQAEMTQLGARLAAQDPKESSQLEWDMTGLGERLVGGVRKALFMLLGAVVLVLLVACSNFANLLLVRGTARRQEWAVRASLGASQGDLVRQLSMEGVLLGLLGCGIGVVLAYAGVDLLLSFKPADLPRLEDVRVDGIVLGFALSVAVVTAAVFGLIPALQASRGIVGHDLKAGSATTVGGTHRWLGGMVVAQVALALVLLVGAGLLINCLSRLYGVAPGYDPRGVMTLRLELPEARYESQLVQSQFRAALLRGVAELPGTRSALVSEIPLGGDPLTHNLSFADRTYEEGKEPEVISRSVAGDFFGVMGIRILEGRALAASDGLTAPRVAVVNESFARTYYRGMSPVGRRVRWDRTEGPPQWITIVGVAADVRYFRLDAGDLPAVYTPYDQSPQAWKRWMCLVTRGPDAEHAGFARALERKVWSVDPALPVTRMMPMNDVVAESLAERRFYLSVLAIFALVGVTLASLGIYGVTSYVTARRTREIGLRMALGAHGRDVFLHVLRGCVRLVALGIVLGAGGALLLTGVMRGLLYQVRPNDPMTLAATATLLAVVAVAAGAIPALRASRVDPLVALRAE